RVASSPEKRPSHAARPGRSVMYFARRSSPLRSRFVMHRDDQGAGYRHARLEKLILEELKALLDDEVSDPALDGVSIRAVVLSPGCRTARVHLPVRAGAAGDARAASVRAAKERALARASPFLRARLMEAIDMKRATELRFVFDGVATSDEGGGA